MKSTWGGEALRILIILVVATLPRLMFLDADPPSDFQTNYMPDEGLYAQNARQHALFGQWIMDDHNVALYTASLHTAALRASYAAFGTGLWQTRLPGAVAAILTCLILYVFMRRETTIQAAFVAALLLATSGFFLANSRVAYTESLQTLFATLGFFAALRARHAWWWGAVSAAALIAAMLAKPSSISAIAVVVVFVALQIATDRGGRKPWLAATAAFSVAGIAILGALALAVQPYWQNLGAAISEMARTSAGAHAELPVLHKILLYGFRTNSDSVRELGGWLARDGIMIFGVGLLGFARLTRLDRSPLSKLEVGGWLWLLLSLAVFANPPALPPDRRFVLIMPAFAILLALTAFDRREPAGATAETGRLRLLLAWLAALLVPGVFLRGLLLPVLRAATQSLKFGAEAGFSTYTLLAALWLLVFVVATVMVVKRKAWFSWLSRPQWAIALCATALGVNVAQATIETVRPRFEIRDASRAIGRMAEELPPERRAAVGITSITLALETDLFAFIVRDWPEADVLLNLDGIERFKPGLAVFTTLSGVPVGGDEGFEVSAAKRVVVFDYHRRPGDPEGLRTTVHVLP